MLTGKKILLGITGGISVYKMCTVVRLLKKAGADVRVIMTPSAAEFVTPLTFSTLSQNEVLTSLFPDKKNSSTNLGVKHIDYGLWADVMLLAPATANTLARLTYGLAEEIVSSTVLALRAPVIIAPAMDVDMWNNDATQHNAAVLKSRGYFLLPPNKGELASGLSGEGRLPEPQTLVAEIERVLAKTPRDLQRKKILITAGPTYEAIDPVRFIGNRSSGKMGYALAAAAALRGAEVTLISGPVSLETPRHVKRINVETAEEMFRAVIKSASKQDIIIMSAAVADYSPRSSAKEKMKKKESPLLVELQPTKDILKSLGEKKKKNQLLIGFALETTDELKNAKQKLQNKNLDLIVLNSLRDKGAAFGVETNIVTLIDKHGVVKKLPRMPKFDVAGEILNSALALQKKK
ncbi:MAG: bifunctional phosphopantothenoylcysteine decarboxylase/phosphopantothenate--cysteine ligase CoaBC [Bacteroidetes bacterium]|nr:bifunctional phosphopantothenoylcysteine decarboxylase/phosphopantothenate--cysteine ligase CoaBC [Bacteroidota bacterium]